MFYHGTRSPEREDENRHWRRCCGFGPPVLMRLGLTRPTSTVPDVRRQHRVILGSGVVVGDIARVYRSAGLIRG